MTPTIPMILRDHVSLEVRCIDRLYLTGYLPKRQTSGGLCYFFQEHLGYPLPSPALFRPLHDRFVAAVHAFATRRSIPVIRFGPKQRKDDVIAGYRARYRGWEGSSRSAWPQKRCAPSKPTNGRGPVARSASISPGNPLPSITTTSTSRIANGAPGS